MMMFDVVFILFLAFDTQLGLGIDAVLQFRRVSSSRVPQLTWIWMSTSRSKWVGEADKCNDALWLEMDGLADALP